MPGYSAGIALPYDPDQARALLAEAGYPGGHNFPTIEWLIPDAGDQARDYVQTQWRQNLGVELTWELVDWPTTFLDRLAKNLPHLYFMGWIADYPDPDNFLRTCVFRQNTGWQHQGYDELVERARQMMDQAERMQLYAQAEQILIEEAPIIPLVYGRQNQLVKPWVSRFPISAIEIWFLKDVIIEPH
jgi:oligopeptide transport system substrate-binding protein